MPRIQVASSPNANLSTRSPIDTQIPIAKKDSLSEAYNSLFIRKAFRGADEPSEEDILAAKNTAPTETKVEAAVESGPPKFTKTVLKKGDKIGFPRKGSNGNLSTLLFFSFFFDLDATGMLDHKGLNSITYTLFTHSNYHNK